MQNAELRMQRDRIIKRMQPLPISAFRDQTVRVQEVLVSRVGDESDDYCVAFVTNEGTLNLIGKIFPSRPCEGPEPGRPSGVPCLDYHIKRCLAPCVGYISKAEYRALIDQIISFLSGQYRGLEVDLEVKMKAAAQALMKLARDPRYVGGQIGILAVLHSWTTTLAYHPHVHCLVPAGGVTQDGRWVAARKSYLVPVDALNEVNGQAHDLAVVDL